MQAYKRWLVLSVIRAEGSDGRPCHLQSLSGEKGIRGEDGAQRGQGVGYPINRANRARQYRAGLERLEQVEQVEQLRP